MAPEKHVLAGGECLRVSPRPTMGTAGPAAPVGAISIQDKSRELTVPLSVCRHTARSREQPGTDGRVVMCSPRSPLPEPSTASGHVCITYIILKFKKKTYNHKKPVSAVPGGPFLTMPLGALRPTW